MGLLISTCNTDSLALHRDNLHVHTDSGGEVGLRNGDLQYRGGGLDQSALPHKPDHRVTTVSLLCGIGIRNMDFQVPSHLDHLCNNEMMCCINLVMHDNKRVLASFQGLLLLLANPLYSK